MGWLQVIIWNSHKESKNHQRQKQLHIPNGWISQIKTCMFALFLFDIFIRLNLKKHANVFVSDGFKDFSFYDFKVYIYSAVQCFKWRLTKTIFYLPPKNKTIFLKEKQNCTNLFKIWYLFLKNITIVLIHNKKMFFGYEFVCCFAGP